MNGIYGYGNGYGYAPPYMPQMGTGAQMPQRCQVIKVNGRNGADAFRMAADSSVLLLDENEPIVWLKTTDGAGYPTITPYSIAPYQPAPEINVNDLEIRIKRLEDILNGKPLLPTLTWRGYFYFALLFAFALKLLAAVAAVHGMKFTRYIGFAFFALHYSP